MAETVDETIRELDEEPRYSPTPWQDINDHIAGWRPGALYVIGARPARQHPRRPTGRSKHARAWIRSHVHPRNGAR